jgi:hypothetical protein
MASDNPNICPNKNELNENEESVLEDKKYELVKDDKLYEINICKMKDKIYLKHFYYEIKLNAEELSQIFKIILSSIDEAYKYITNIFNKNKVKIKFEKYRILKKIKQIKCPNQIFPKQSED